MVFNFLVIHKVNTGSDSPMSTVKSFFCHSLPGECVTKMNILLFTLVGVLTDRNGQLMLVGEDTDQGSERSRYDGARHASLIIAWSLAF